MPREYDGMYEGPDHLTKMGAAKLMKRIREYWKERGYVVKLWSEPLYSVPDFHESFVIRSDMVGGLPKEFQHG